MPTYEVEEIHICDESGLDGTFIVASCEVDCVMTEPADPGCPPSLGHPGEPPWPAVYEVEEVRLTVDVSNPFAESETETLTMSEQDFRLFFAQGDRICNDAMEWACGQEE